MEAPASRENGTLYRPPSLGGGNLNGQNSHISVVWGGWPVKDNKMCGCRDFKEISDERAHSNGRLLVNFSPMMKLIFGSVKKGSKGFLLSQFSAS